MIFSFHTLYCYHGSFQTIYNKTKNINKSSLLEKPISFKAYDILKKFVVNGLVNPETLDSAYPKNTKLNVIKNVSQRSMNTFYKLSDKYSTNKLGIISQISIAGPKKKKKLSLKAKELLKKIKTDTPRYENIDLLISKFKRH